MAAAYGLVCILGVIAVLFPTACSGVFGIRKAPAGNLRSADTRATIVFGVLVLHGHHSPGLDAIDHELHFRGKSYCATCFGFLTGAALGLVAVAAYAVWSGPSRADVPSVYALYSGGVIMMIIGFVPILIVGIKASTRFFFAALFVVGTGLMLIGTDLRTEDLVADLYVVLLAVFWLVARISFLADARSSCR